MITVKRYIPNDKGRWDDFCRSSVNGVFLFFRDYMDYHSDRFCDHSLLFFEKNRLVALLPCNETMEVENDSGELRKFLSSHDGLTFGSFIMGNHAHLTTMFDCVEALIDYCKKEGITKVYFKPVPLLFQRQPAEQDVYALMKFGAKLIGSMPSTITHITEYRPNLGEKYSCRYASDAHLSFQICEEDENWEQFHLLLSQVLYTYHGVSPVHSLSELTLLRHRFADNMKLFAVFDGNDMIAGVVIYEYNDSVHTQYMASNEIGRNKRALHYCMQGVIDHYRGKKWLDFGISTENDGTVLNEGLVRFKEGFKGNTLLYNKWCLEK